MPEVWIMQVLTQPAEMFMLPQRAVVGHIPFKYLPWHLGSLIRVSWIMPVSISEAKRVSPVLG